MSKVSGRLIIAIVSSILEETIIVGIVLWGLPQLGVQIPLIGLIALMAAWATYSVFSYRMGSRALRRKPMLQLPDMVGGTGTVVNRLAPEGMIKIKGELWVAESADGELEIGRRVIVVGQNGLRLDVRPVNSADDAGMAE